MDLNIFPGDVNLAVLPPGLSAQSCCGQLRQFLAGEVEHFLLFPPVGRTAGPGARALALPQLIFSLVVTFVSFVAPVFPGRFSLVRLLLLHLTASVVTIQTLPGRREVQHFLGGTSGVIILVVVIALARIRPRERALFGAGGGLLVLLRI